jgi:hypothetical protein
MRKDNEQDLLITKFRASAKEKQDQLLKFLLTENINIDSVIDFLNNKELTNDSKGFKAGDIIFIDPFNLSTYPEIDIEWYTDEGLIINGEYVNLKVEYINPINGHPALTFRTKQNKKLEVIEVYLHYIPDQKQFHVITA